MVRWFVLAAAFFIPLVSFADSSLFISKVVAEVPGTNEGHQYIEVTNTGSDPIDLGAKTIRLVDHSGRHLIKSLDGSGTILMSGSKVIVAQNPDVFRSDNPGYSGIVLKSSFSLTKFGTVSLAYTDGTLLATKTYSAQVAAKKLSVETSGSKKQERHYSSRTSTKTAYGKGITAPSAKANAEAGGASYALPVSPEVLAFIQALVSNAWFAVFLGLVAFSVFSLAMLFESQKFA